MSLQKSQSARKFQSNIQAHTKSKLINTLINQKLSQQKEVVKNRFVKLVKQAQNAKQIDRPSSGSGFKVRKVSGSLKNINISMQKIKQSITFNPLRQQQRSQQSQFIISRQYKSPIILPQQIQQVVSARNNSHLIEIKLSERDKKGYQYVSLAQSQQPLALNLQIQSKKALDNEDKGDKDRPTYWVKKMQQQLDNQLWLPHSPHVQMLLQNMEGNNQRLKIYNNIDLNELPIVKSPTFTNYGNTFTPIKTSPSLKLQRTYSLLQTTNLNSKLLQNIHTQKQEIIYDFKKYNNNDFLALQKWFEKNISSAHKKFTQSQRTQSKLRSTLSIKDQQKVNINQKQLLNLLYQIHIGGFQQLIRLQYVQAWQKALIFQKMFWSLIRLFSSLMQEQHKINFNEFKSFQKQLKDQRLMYEQRCEKLQKMMLRAQSQSSSTQILRKRLSLAYVTYSRVNSHLCQQLQIMNKNYTQLQASFQYLNLRMMKVIEHMTMQNRVKIIANQYQTTYYLIVGKTQKLQELIRIKTQPEESKKIMKKKVQQQIQEKLKKQGKLSFHKSSQKDRQAIEKQILAKRALIQQNFEDKPVFQTRVGERISKVQHELNKYWLNKEQSLQVNKIIKSQLLNYQTSEKGTSTYQKYEVSSFGSQFPQKQQKSFAEFLKEQLQKEKQTHQKEIKQQSDLYVSLKDLYEQSYQKIRLLQGKNKELVLELQAKDLVIEQKDFEIMNLSTQVQQRQIQLQSKLSNISQLLNDKTTLQLKIQQIQLSLQLHQNRFQTQLQNSQNLVRNNLQLKQKLQKLSIKLKQTQQKLHDTVARKHQIQIQLDSMTQKSKQFEDRYQNLHKKLQKIAPSVDKFLDFKRYDIQSIIIANLKKDLQKLFPEYFCKDSDVFLTKG